MMPTGKHTAQSGFSLIELIATMVIMGIIGLGASLFLTYIVQGFIIAQANQTAFQKINLAMERLTLEMKHMEEITAHNATSIRFQRDGQPFGIALVSGTIKINRGTELPDPDTGFVLIDDVTSFNLTCENSDASAWTVLVDNSLTGLARVRITLTINLEGTSRTFTVDVNPLFNNMVNGPTS